MKGKTFEFTIKKKCTKFDKCSDEIIEKLKPLGLKLRADNENDIVNGYVSMVHAPNNHSITIAVYEETENPNAEHLTTLKRPSKVPTQNQIEKLLK